MQVAADLKGLESYIGGIRGMVEAMETPGVKDGFVKHVMNKTKKQFMLDTIAVNEAGMPSIKHAFEWGDTAGEGSSIPLFKITGSKSGPAKVLSYTFLPSTKPVPKPDASYGIDSETMSKIRPQIFPMKAFVMETQNRVDITPVRSKMLLVPTHSSPRGFVFMSASKINPGGVQATGGFANWWNTWFDAEAQVIARGESVKMEQKLEKTGQRIVRWAAGTTMNGASVGGRFAKQKAVEFGYVSGQAARWKGNVEKELRRFYDDDELDGDA